MPCVDHVIGGRFAFSYSVRYRVVHVSVCMSVRTHEVNFWVCQFPCCKHPAYLLLVYYYILAFYLISLSFFFFAFF